MPGIRFAVLVLLTAVTVLPGCMTFEVGSKGSRHVDSENSFETIHGSFYGFEWSKHHVQKCDESGFTHLEFHFNALQLAASVTTLGLYVPQTVEWWCNDISTTDDEDGLEPNPSDEFGHLHPRPGDGANL